MKKISIIVLALAFSVIVPISAFAACGHAHGHGSGAAGLLGNNQPKIKWCVGGGYIYLNDPTANCPK